MASPATPATPANRLVLTIETDACGLDAKQVAERFQKFFEFYHAAFNVKVKAVSPVILTVSDSPALPLLDAFCYQIGSRIAKQKGVRVDEVPDREVAIKINSVLD